MARARKIPMSNLELLNLWAKSSPFKRLEQHLRETALVAEILLTKSAFAANLNRLCESLNVDSDETVRLTKYLVYLHDIGKAHPLFQCNECCNEAYIFFQAHPEYRYPVNISGYRHEIGSADIMRKVWGNSGKYDRATSQTFSSILAIHHQGRSQSSIGLFDEDDEWEYASEWVGLQESIAEDAEKLFSPPEISVKRMKHVDSACMVITAFIIMADWIASGDYLCISSEANSDEDIQGAVLHFLKDAALDGSLRTLPIAFTDLWPQIPRDSLRPVQAELEQFLSSGERMPLALIIEAPMGEGKTEAGICGAVKMGNYWGKNGLYIALPTAATANQMVDRVNVLLESHGISKARMIHSTAWLRQEVDFHLEDVQTLSAAEKWMMPNKRGLLAQYAVGTIDQSLMAALRIKYGVLRLLGLSSKVLIIDEVHAYDAYMSDILLKLLAWCRALYIPVVLLSATLPSE